MDDYNEALKMVYSKVAPEVDELYEYYRKKKGLKDEVDTATQLKILVDKKYISKTYISDLSLITEYYVQKMIGLYLDEITRYKDRIKNFLGDY